MYVERSLRSAHRYLRRPRLKLGGRPYNSPPSGGTGPGTSTSTAAQLSLRPSSRPEGSWAGGRAQSKGQARRLATAPLKGQSSSPCPAVARNSASLPERAGLGARSTPACGGLVPFTHHTVLSILSACKFRHVRGPSPTRSGAVVGGTRATPVKRLLTGALTADCGTEMRGTSV
jgi:hypothetical protein